MIVAVLMTSSTTNAQPNRDSDAVSAAVDSLRVLMINPDRNALHQIVMESLSYGHSSGKIEDKTAFVNALVNGSSDFVTIDLSDQRIIVSGNTAIVRHTLVATTNDGGKPGNVKLSIMLVWQKDKRNWKLLARQAVKI